MSTCSCRLLELTLPCVPPFCCPPSPPAHTACCPPSGCPSPPLGVGARPSPPPHTAPPPFLRVGAPSAAQPWGPACCQQYLRYCLG